ncbi:DsbA family oxidoreductase [Jongsikchunia kroppenstedtii]|uniref:DsbA family oxidoreductase n=1 Tax=Jongsikchunia kroppenstedtii TaxID=1121721 RepID=UPI00037C5384|nr:DsbA family oxidoreductase [Jongsikchunia kroppenstedtii]
MAPTVSVDIWTDINCPFCYLGKRRFEQALEQFEHRDAVRVTHHSFELDPTLAPGHSAQVIDWIASKYGMPREQAEANERSLGLQAEAVGLGYEVDGRDYGNSFDMHRLLHLALEKGKQDAVIDALYAANFAAPQPLFGDPDRLIAVVTGAGLDESDVRRVLDSDEYADAVRADEQRAAELGAGGVPFFVLNNKYAVSGAQPPELFAQALQQCWDDAG